jgi:hypothetical protein
MKEYYNILNYLPIEEIVGTIPCIVVFIISISWARTSLKTAEAISINKKQVNAIHRFQRGFSIFLIVSSSFILIFTTLTFGGNYFKLRKYYINKEYHIVEGIVENFDPMPYTGHKSESFTVDGIKFEYSDNEIDTGAFRKTKSHGGPIDEGLYVKIYYVGNSIIGLWVEDKNIQ